MKSRTFRRLSDAWQRRLRESNALFLKLVEDDASPSAYAVTIKKFPHQLFAYFLCPSVDEATLRLAAERLVVRLERRDIGAMVIASFPWDFVCITVFAKKDLAFPEKPGVATLRISIPDLSAPDVETCAEVFAGWLAETLKPPRLPGRSVGHEPGRSAP